MWWLGTGPLYVRLFEGDTATICEIATVEGEESVLEFGADVSNEAILDCDTFREALQELSILSSTTASLRFSPDQPRFALRAPPTVSGVDSIAQIGGEVTIVLADPSDPGCDVFQSFRSEHTQEYVYKLEHLGRCIKALGMAESCKVAMNAVGGLSVMCRMRDDGFARGERCFVEFIVASQESEDAEGSAEASAEASADEQGVEEESDEDDEVAGSDEDFV